MKLYIRFGSLRSFKDCLIATKSEQVLTPTMSNVSLLSFETDDLSEVRRLLSGNNIKFDIK